MWPRAYWLKSSSSDASLADTDIVCGGGGGGGGGGEGGRELGMVVCCVMCDVACPGFTLSWNNLIVVNH